MARMALSVCLSCLFLSLPSLASNLVTTWGTKYPNTQTEGSTPVVSTALAPKDVSQLSGFTELLPYVTPSPDQYDAGTCMFMSLTGVVEWWMMRLGHSTQFVQDGPYDLSERWWVNESVWSDNVKDIDNWYTDGIYLWSGKTGYLNSSYRYTKGWYTEKKEGGIKKAKPNAPGALYDTSYNWIDETDHIKGKKVKMPKFTRRVIYADPDENPWSIGKAPANIVEQVKEALLTEKSPVQVIYNHEGFWHSVFILGFDENMSSQNCPFLQESQDYFKAEADKAQKAAEETENAKDKEKLLNRAKKYNRYLKTLTTAIQKGGGCHEGMFYVRDSIYSDPSEELYHYDLSNPAGDTPYSKRIILREFDWLRYLGNNVTVITAEEPVASF